ncbi:Abi family protein [Enorma phocaeensis]|uniref:Abi family protein n=1 Tax=Enorma phocaeensis TaxID=1871019 RepID=UPI000C84F142|nr:Abi family protein [Enorma phocaeensis]
MMENGSSTEKDGKIRCSETAKGGINNTDSTPHARGNAANQAGSSSFRPLPVATTFEQQLAKLEERGLYIGDEDFAIAKLKDLNYYRLRGYWLTLEREGRLVEGASFNDVWEIYQLDAGLREWLWHAIAPIEVKLRTQFAYHLGNRCGVDAYLHLANFKNAHSHAAALKGFVRERDRAYRQGVPCVIHNMDKYGRLPVWAAVEIMSLGTLSMLYGNLDPGAGRGDGDKGVAALVASSFGTKPRYLGSWAHHLTTVRNIAAHHDRFYNRLMTIQPLMLRQDRAYAGAKQFPTLLIIKRIYERSWPEEWGYIAAELAALVDAHPGVDLAPMGFPAEWKGVLGLS